MVVKRLLFVRRLVRRRLGQRRGSFVRAAVQRQAGEVAWRGVAPPDLWALARVRESMEGLLVWRAREEEEE